VSVYDKTGLESFASGLRALDIEIVASGGTAKVLEAAGIEHLAVSEVTGVPEMLGGRVKTLHPAVHAAILADRSLEKHLKDLAAQNITAIDLVVCNLYPFEQHPCTEMMDIGGPAMIRAAAKNSAHVTVVVDPLEYGVVLEELRSDGRVSAFTRRRLARAGFAHTAAYDAGIVRWLDETNPEDPERDEQLPPSLHLVLERVTQLRYGENPHQSAARYREHGVGDRWWDGARQHGGRELSYLNLLDAEAAWQLVHELVGADGLSFAKDLSGAVIVKHTNACGAAVAQDLAQAYAKAVDGDALSAFGGIVALSGPVDDALGELIVNNTLADVLVAPGFEEAALARFAAKRKNMRVIEAPLPTHQSLSVRQTGGGYLVQQRDSFCAEPNSWQVVTTLAPSQGEWRDLELAWRVCARSTSNAIVLARDGQAVGVGCGQQSRVDAAQIASRKADGRAKGGAAASDAYFPFRDGLDALADAGVAVVVQPGGSIHDQDLIAAADERQISMVFTHERHFRH
jgi:phosphoribosylaminoimidazolecarboxamide formyltransferase/IMP cyclohydrolase